MEDTSAYAVPDYGGHSRGQEKIFIFVIFPRALP
jgi:hypothetical protein